METIADPQFTIAELKLEEVVDKIYQLVLKNKKLADEITADNLVDITIECMKWAEKVYNLSSLEKKAVVIKVVRKLVESSDKITKSQKKIIDLSITFVISPLIDRIVDASKGKIDINKFGTKVKKWAFNVCCCAGDEPAVLKADSAPEKPAEKPDKPEKPTEKPEKPTEAKPEKPSEAKPDKIEEKPEKPAENLDKLEEIDIKQ